MDLNLEDTIVALATPRRGGLRGIVRLTGPRTVDCLRTCFHCASQWDRHPSARCWPGELLLTVDAEPPLRLPGTLYLWPSSSSFTRQPAAEWHTVGSLPLLDAAVGALCRAGARMATAGEFTLRAFLAGRLDLTQAEAILGVIDAQTQSQLDVALRQLAGGLSLPLAALRDQLTNLLADLEAGLDFADEDLHFVAPHDAAAQLRSAQRQVNLLQQQMLTREVTTTSTTVVLFGRPNVGKSTLWNALIGRGRAIVSAQPGTTRDYLSAPVTLDGVACLLVDTAGVEDPRQLDDVARQAQGLSEAATTHAMLKVLCLDATRSLDDWESQELARTDQQRVVVINKTDLDLPRIGPVVADLAISAHAREDIERLSQCLGQRLREVELAESPVVTSTALRCRTSLIGATACLAEACELVERRAGDELVAVALRGALDELGNVLGAFYTDDLLDRIFSRFCIGK